MKESSVALEAITRIEDRAIAVVFQVLKDEMVYRHDVISQVAIFSEGLMSDEILEHRINKALGRKS
jgi:hypothetical protein